MALVVAASSNKRDEIPVATRNSSPRKKYGASKKVKILRFFGGCLFLVFPFLGLRLFENGPLIKVSNPEEQTSAPPVKSLLGHFPYPEADPNDLVYVSGISMHADTAQAFRRMRKEAALEGITLSLLSGYRSHDLQREIFFDIKSQRNQTAVQRAQVSAPPGYSEHSTGFAIDLGDANWPETHFEVSFEATPAFKWLEKNAPRFHFVLSFPRDNLQGVSYEPWHWRFEGSAAALLEFEHSRPVTSKF